MFARMSRRVRAAPPAGLLSRLPGVLRDIPRFRVHTNKARLEVCGGRTHRPARNSQPIFTKITSVDAPRARAPFPRNGAPVRLRHSYLEIELVRRSVAAWGRSWSDR